MLVFHANRILNAILNIVKKGISLPRRQTGQGGKTAREDEERRKDEVVEKKPLLDQGFLGFGGGGIVIFLKVGESHRLPVYF